MASQLKVFVDWSSIPIWCCGKSFIYEEISKHAEENHNKPECALIHKSPAIKSKEAQVKINIDKDDKNNNSIPIVNNEKREILLGRGKSDDKKYYCDKCEYTAKRKSGLTVHIENKHLGIRHECEVCHFRYTTIYNLVRHRTKKHRKTAIEQDAVTPSPNSFQNENMDVSEIKLEIVTPPHLSDIVDIKREIVTPPPPEIQNDVTEMKQEIETASPAISDVAEIKQEIETASPAISDNHIDSVPAHVLHNSQVPDLTQVKEEVDDENLQVPGWRILPQFEPPPLDDREGLKAGKRKVDYVGVEEQQRISKLHSKLEKQEKIRKKWDARWWKRLAEIQKLQEVKDRDDGKDVKMEGQDIEVLWPNEDLITDLLIVDDVREDMDAVIDDTVQNTNGVVDDMEVVRDDLDQRSDAVVDGVGLDSDVVMDNLDVAESNMGQNSLSS